MASDQVQPIKDTLNKAKDMYVLVPQNPNLDTMAAALSLYQILKSTGKGVYIGCPSEMKAEFSRLVEIDKVTEEIGNRNLVISLKVATKDAIDKVSYNLTEDGKTFNLVVQPKSGTEPLKSKDVDFSYSGADAELVFIVGSGNPEDLAHFYTEEKKLFQNAQTVSVTRFPATGGTVYNFNDPEASSLSEIVYQLAKELGFQEVSADAATNILSGIDNATNQLQHPMIKANTFETIADLLKAGGIRQISNTTATAFPNKPYQPTTPTMPEPEETVIKGEVQSETPEDAPKEWLQPKIYKTPKK